MWWRQTKEGMSQTGGDICRIYTHARPRHRHGSVTIWCASSETMIPWLWLHLHAKMPVESLPKAISPFNGDHTWGGRGVRCATKSHDSAGRKQSLVAKAERGTSPSDGEMPWPESLRGDDAERAKGTDVSGNNSGQVRMVCRRGPKWYERCAFSVRLSCELTSSCVELRLEAALACCSLSKDSACRPTSARPAVGHVQNPAKKGRRVDTPVAKEHGNVPSRAWQLVGLTLFPVLAPSRG